MVQLDWQLLHEARRLITGANVHRLKELIFAYEQAVDLHNRGWQSHQEYQPQHESQLRRYVITQQLTNLDQAINATRFRPQAFAAIRLHFTNAAKHSKGSTRKRRAPTRFKAEIEDQPPEPVYVCGIDEGDEHDVLPMIPPRRTGALRNFGRRFCALSARNDQAAIRHG